MLKMLNWETVLLNHSDGESCQDISNKADLVANIWQRSSITYAAEEPHCNSNLQKDVDYV